MLDKRLFTNSGYAFQKEFTLPQEPGMADRTIGWLSAKLGRGSERERRRSGRENTTLAGVAEHISLVTNQCTKQLALPSSAMYLNGYKISPVIGRVTGFSSLRNLCIHVVT